MLPALLLQKPSKNSKSKEHLKRLEERMALWYDGQITTLLKEGTVIQEHLTSGKRRSPEETAKVFSNLMLQGKINAALNLLSTESNGGVLPLSHSVINDLQEKHPPPAPIKENSLIFGPVDNVASNYFDSIDEQTIAKAAPFVSCAALAIVCSSMESK
jgi:hypothetical protein